MSEMAQCPAFVLHKKHSTLIGQSLDQPQTSKLCGQILCGTNMVGKLTKKGPYSPTTRETNDQNYIKLSHVYFEMMYHARNEDLKVKIDNLSLLSKIINEKFPNISMHIKRI